jgi:hypothetical protein
MTLSEAEATTGFIDGTPTASVEDNAGGTFTGSSTSGLTSGCAGKVSYSLDDGTGVDDGTLVNIRYYTAYPYGPSDNSSYTVGFQGAHANRYQIANEIVQTDPSNGGAGKSVSWTFEIVSVEQG